MFILASSLKPYHVTRFDLLRIIFEKEKSLPAVQLDLPVKVKNLIMKTPIWGFLKLLL